MVSKPLLLKDMHPQILKDMAPRVLKDMDPRVLKVMDPLGVTLDHLKDIIMMHKAS